MDSQHDPPDPLTGLANRAALDAWISRTTPEARATVVMYIDVDYFKRVNNTLGHEKGDRVLRQIAVTLGRLVERYGNSTVYRYGGDEFVVVMLDYSIDEGLALARTLKAHVAALDAAKLSLHVSLSIGLASSELATPVELLMNADRALRLAKRNGRNQLQVFDPTLLEAAPVSANLDDVAAQYLATREGLVARQASRFESYTDAFNDGRNCARYAGPHHPRRVGCGGFS
jgi:diguanylate cyclase (GGDEF)-like protein